MSLTKENSSRQRKYSSMNSNESDDDI